MATAQINGGPRLAALADALAGAVAAFEAPLDDEEVSSGWSDPAREGVLATLRDAASRLAADPTARLSNPEADVAADVAFEDDARTEALAAVEWCEVDLDVAAEALAAAQAFEADHRRPVGHDDVAAGLTTELVAAIGDAAAAIRALLEAGEYLTEAAVATWDQLLADHGVVRREFDSPPSSNPFAISVARSYAGQVESWPKSRRWDRIISFDSDLWTIRRRDLGTQ